MIETIDETDLKKRWDEYLSSIPSAMQEMWSFIHYNKFTNEEVVRLNRKIRFLNDDIETERKLNKRLKRERDALKDKYQDQVDTKNVGNRRKRKANTMSASDASWFRREKKRPTKYTSLCESEQIVEIQNCFKNLTSIEDIINLKTYPHRFDFINTQTKFKTLYKIIPSLERLNAIIGMKDVKEEVFRMICYFLHGLQNTEELNHIVITGSPGVGKTTLAKLLGNIYLKLGFLKNNVFLSARRSDLIGKYCGHTAKQTQEMIDKAKGGVLFIDEVYSLGNPEKKDSFTKECIDTINQSLTEEGGSFLCIIAGYEKEVDECFFAYNKGLERRFPIRFNIKSYDATEMFAILTKIAKEDGYVVDPKLQVADIEKDLSVFKFFGADMRSLLQQAKMLYSIRLMKESTDLRQVDRKMVITCEDFKKAIENMKSKRCVENKDDNNALFYMYT